MTHIHVLDYQRPVKKRSVYRDTLRKITEMQLGNVEENPGINIHKQYFLQCCFDLSGKMIRTPPVRETKKFLSN